MPGLSRPQCYNSNVFIVAEKVLQTSACLVLSVNCFNHHVPQANAPNAHSPVAAVGCATLVAPPGVTIVTEGQLAVITCNYTLETWNLVCTGTVWRGERGNCSRSGECKHSASKPVLLTSSGCDSSVFLIRHS